LCIPEFHVPVSIRSIVDKILARERVAM
jgi:hypothetical protein